MAKIIATLVWVIALVVVNKLLDDNDWAQYAITFIMGGIYVLLINKVGSPGARNRQ
ncbi:hypothetical protein [Streptomyces sp. NPDC049585]|uniref:hypothetical protein n=1 Tax=Streptomyces sp. NPDC049585 TaxID=3155154 RepID=UPI00343A7D7C